MIGIGAKWSGTDVERAWTAVSEFAKVLSISIETFAPSTPVGAGLKVSRPIAEKLVKGTQALMLVRQHEEVLAQRWELFSKLLQEGARDPATLHFWERWKSGREAAIEANRRFQAVWPRGSSGFGRWSTLHLRRRGRIQVGQGLLIVDPDEDIWQLSHLPGINPEFVRALVRQRALLRQGNLEAASAANKNANGYIHAFGGNRTRQLSEGSNVSGRSYEAGQFGSSEPQAETLAELERALERTQQQVDQAADELERVRQSANSALNACYSPCFQISLDQGAGACMDACRARYHAVMGPPQQRFWDAVKRRDALRERRHALRRRSY
jgi:hypothetical protein